MWLSRGIVVASPWKVDGWRSVLEGFEGCLDFVRLVHDSLCLARLNCLKYRWTGTKTATDIHYNCAIIIHLSIKWYKWQEWY